MSGVLSCSEVGSIQGTIFLFFRGTVYKVEYCKECEEDIQVWFIQIEEMNHLRVVVTPCYLPWSVVGRVEVRVITHMDGYSTYMQAGVCLIQRMVDILQGYIMSQQVPYWVVEVFNILETVGDDFEESCVGNAWLGEE